MSIQTEIHTLLYMSTALGPSALLTQASPTSESGHLTGSHLCPVPSLQATHTQEGPAYLNRETASCLLQAACQTATRKKKTRKKVLEKSE